MRRLDLSGRVRLFTTLGIAVIWIMSVVLMSAVLRSEQDELFDQQLSGMAHAMLPLLSQAQGVPGLRAPEPALDPDEALVYRLFGADGAVLRESGATAALPAPSPEAADAFTLAPGYRVFTTGFNAAGHALQLAAPLAERREALREGMTGFLVLMLALLPLTWLLVGWIARRALAPLHALGEEIAARDGSRLDPIDASDWPEDLVRIAGTLNGFMARLTQALDGERAFATNAAHELRTPVAIALAQVQQLRAGADAAQVPRIEALERALQRMRRLVARLLQLARADAGIGLSAEPHDIAALTRLVLGDVVPRTASDRVEVSLPPMPVPARIDPDAFAIVLGNLVENALQHGPPDGRVAVTVRPDAVLEVANGGSAVAGLDTLPRRFVRRGRDGFGLGLHICAQIAAQAGGRLDLLSPVPGRAEGFMVRVSLQGAGLPK